jgi:hypothetical protein
MESRPQSPVVFTVTPHQLNIFLGGYMKNRMKQLPTIQVGAGLGSLVRGWVWRDVANFIVQKTCICYA